MKKLFIVLLIAITLTGCSDLGSGNDLNPTENYQVIEIEGCEYIFISCRPFAREMAITHKGNCKNPVHKE